MGHVIAFTIHTDPVGYYARGSRPDGKRLKQYLAWRSTVQHYALAAGVKLPLVASRTEPLYIVTRAYFRSGVHPDPENVHKGVVDALFYAKPKGGADKHVGGSFSWPLYDADLPRVEVQIFRKCDLQGVG